MLHTLRTFTPSEAAKVSGVNVTLQRDWRRRDILPKVEGHARFTAFDVAELMALNAIAAAGYGPLQFKPVARLLGAGIVSSALDKREAYSGAFESIIGSDSWILDQLKNTHPVDFDYVLTTWRASRARDLIMKLAGHQPSEVMGAFVRWAEGSYGFYPSPITPFETIDLDDPRRQGAIMILDLDALGDLFAKRAGAFVAVEEDMVSNGRPGPKRLMAAIEEIIARRRMEKGAAE